MPCSQEVAPTTAVEKSSPPITRKDDNADDTSSLPYWVVNVPRENWPSECPEFLRNQPLKNIKTLSTPDELYQRQGWEEVKRIIETNQLEDFRRVPSDLRKYLEYTAKIKAAYGSVLNFVVSERLHWGGDMTPRGTKVFEHPEKKARGEVFRRVFRRLTQAHDDGNLSIVGRAATDDYKILFNDWPYGIEQGIVHLVVWTKFELEDDPTTDDLTPQARREIDDFVETTFRSKMPAGEVIWFKNWKRLKSVHAVEHFHVMLHRPDMQFVHDLTQGDVPLVEKL